MIVHSLLGVATTSTLALRTDEVISLAFVVKLIAVMIVLLVLLYAVLRFLSRHVNKADAARPLARMEKEHALRLSARTTAHLLRVDNTRLLVVESATGIAISVISGPPLADTACANAAVNAATDIAPAYSAASTTPEKDLVS